MLKVKRILTRMRRLMKRGRKRRAVSPMRSGSVPNGRPGMLVTSAVCATPPGAADMKNAIRSATASLLYRHSSYAKSGNHVRAQGCCDPIRS